MPKPFIPPTIQLPDLLDSTTSNGSISNFVAQTPKDHRLQNQNKKLPIIKLNEFKQNNLQASNLYPLESRLKHQLPYKMVSSQLPASCINHPQKESSFYIQSDQKQLIFYCQKCAILVASQGFTVKKIQSTYESKRPKTQNDQQTSTRLSIKNTKTIKKSKMNQNMLTKQHKESELNNFLNMLQRIQTRMDKVYDENQDKLAQIDTCGQTQEKRIKEIFGNLHRVLDDFEQFYYNELESKSQKLRQPFEVQIEQLTNDTNTLESMKQDICQAYDDIINHTTSAQFETVMNVYNQNVQNVQNSLQQKETTVSNKNILFIKSEMKVQIQPQDIMNALKKQMQSLLEPPKRPSVKSSQRRISINGNQIR